MKVKVKSLSHVRLFVTPWTVVYQVLPSMGFSRQEYWSGLPFPSPGDLPDPRIEPRVSHIVGRCFIVWATREVSVPLFFIDTSIFCLSLLLKLCFPMKCGCVASNHELKKKNHPFSYIVLPDNHISCIRKFLGIVPQVLLCFSSLHTCILEL